MKKLILIITALIFALLINAQENSGIKRNNMFLEIGGAGYLGSLNYERMLTDNTELNFPLRIGLLYLYGSGMPSKSHNLIVPMSVSVIKKIQGSDNLYWEFKAITSCFYKIEMTSEDPRGRWPESTENSIMFVPAISLGLRRHDFSCGFYYHLHFQMSYNNEDDSNKKLSPWFSVGLGHTF